MIACHDCDQLHRPVHLPAGAKALCARCGALLHRHVPNSLDRALALNLAALLLFILANTFPFLSLKLGGRVEENLLISGAVTFYEQGMVELAVLVFVTAILFPALTIGGMLYLLTPLKLGFRPPAMGRVYRMVQTLAPWSLVGVFMLGVLVSMVKLLDLATIIPGVSLFSLMALLLVSTAAKANLDPEVLWPRTPHPTGREGGKTAAARGLVACHTCGLLVDGRHAHHPCPRCDTALHGRKHNSFNRTLSLVVASWLLLIPANLYPVMTVIRFSQGEPSTILQGVVQLIEGGMWGLALLVFFASIVVPISKLVILSMLLYTVRNRSGWRPHDRTRLFRLTEVVGAWSMVDVFLVAILSALVKLDALATIEPGIGVSFFAAVVVITMFAAHSFDPRLIWDHNRNNDKE